MPIDSMLQPRVGSLHAGVSRQAPLLRSPSQMEEIINFMPSVEIGGLADRNGTQCIAMLGAANYASVGHYQFKTPDGQRWAFMRGSATGTFEVRSLTSGGLASLTIGPYVQNYLAGTTRPKFLTIAATTFILNPDLPAQFTPPSVGVNTTRAYVAIRKLSSSFQTFYVNSAAGNASVVYDGSGGVKTREWVAQQLQTACAANMPGVGITRISNVLRFEGAAAVIQSLTGGNDWDETAFTLIKGRVDDLTKLPPTFFHGEPILVDLGNGDAKSSYWVTYDTTTNSYKETSWLDNFATSGTWNQATMPIRLHQTGSASFELQPVDWVPRKAGDDDSNAVPPFNGQTITDMALWKGRLWFASGDWVVSSQPDDLFNFFQSSAREVVASDPVKLQAEADLGDIAYLASFRDSLMVFLEGAQCSVDGSQLVKPDTASLGKATQYDVDPLCAPVVIGDVMLYTGTLEDRAVLWEYQFQQQTENNSAQDLSKHVPRYCPGSVRRLAGSAQSGRTFLWSVNDPSVLYVQTSYWQGQERKQNAWSKVNVPGVTSIWNHWVDAGRLYLIAQMTGYVALLSVPVDANLGQNTTDVRLDLRQAIQVTWNVTRNRSEVVLPDGYYQVSNLCVLVPTNGWFKEYDITPVWDGTQWIGYFTEQIDVNLQCFIGVRFQRSFTLSPFYATVGESQTPMGRLQVHKVILDCLKAGDFTGTVTRPDRAAPMVVKLSSRVIGAALLPATGSNTQYAIPFNAKGDAAQLTVSTDSSAPMIVTGYTLAARYINLFANA
jgi:hypothetical protein